MTNGGLHYRPEDVYSDIKTGRSALVLGEDNDFGVAYIWVDPDTSEQFLHIWIAYADSGDAFEKYWESWIELAKTCECTGIRWESNRVGYIKTLKKLPGAKLFKAEYRASI